MRKTEKERVYKEVNESKNRNGKGEKIYITKELGEKEMEEERERQRERNYQGEKKGSEKERERKN